MLPSTRVFLATLLLLTTGTPHVPAAPPREGVPALAELTDPVRQRLDRAALASPAERAAQRTVDVSGDFTAWLLQRWALTPSEERRAAEEVHRRILADHRGKVIEAPAAVARLFERLVRELPGPARPEEFRYTLTVLDRPEGSAFTTGGGFVYLTRGLLDALAARPEALGFVLSHELGHVALGHCRRGYQLAEVQQEVKRGLRMKLDEGKLKALLETSVAPAGRAIYFLYSR